MSSETDHRAEADAFPAEMPVRRVETRSLGWSRGASSRPYAALDLGTNNCRLLIAKPENRSFRVVDAFSRIVRLGEGIATTGAINEAAMTRTLEALAICARKISDRDVSRLRLVTTEACRVASNGRLFLDRVAKETGLNLEILDRRTEAQLAAAGCAVLADPRADSIILFDIGGGSTEIVWLDVAGKEREQIRTRIRAWASLAIGVVTLAERHGGASVGAEHFEPMVAETTAAMAAFAVTAAKATRARGFHLLGTSGTVTTLGGVHLALERYDRRQVDGLWMNDDEISVVQNRLLAMNYDERAANGCIGRERADLVLAGCAIFEAIRRQFPASRTRIGDRGLREGMLMEMMRDDGAFLEGASR